MIVFCSYRDNIENSIQVEYYYQLSSINLNFLKKYSGNEFNKNMIGLIPILFLILSKTIK